METQTLFWENKNIRKKNESKNIYLNYELIIVKVKHFLKNNNKIEKVNIFLKMGTF